MNGSFWLLWPENPALSAVTVAAAAMLFLYAARAPMHRLFRSSALAVSGPLRVVARWLSAAAEDLSRRNKAVLLAHARQEAEARIEWEFERVSTLVTQDLSGYPALQRKLMDEISRMEEDYRKCGEAPPPPPDWVEALAAIASIKSGGGEMVRGILEQISASVGRIHDKAFAEYRRSCESRHRILGSFLPFWRSVEKTMTQLDGKLAGLQASAAAVDAQMQKYREICAQSEDATRALTVSAFTQAVIAALVLVAAAGGAFVNFKLLALSMPEWVGAGDYVGSSLRTSELAALVIVLVQAAMGLFVMETLRITHLFPAIASLSDHMRRRLFWISLALLVAMAAIEAALALTQQAAVTDGWVGTIPGAGRMLLGFILPFALAFTAIPLESLIHSFRTAGGVLLLAAARLAAFALRLAGQLARHASRVLISLYDVLIVLPLFVERIVKNGSAEFFVRRKSLSGE